MILGRIVVPGSVEARVQDSAARIKEEAGLGMFSCCLECELFPDVFCGRE